MLNPLDTPALLRHWHDLCTAQDPVRVIPVQLAQPGDTARTGVKRFGCSYCELAFNRKDDALRHERKHTGEKPFKCSYCECVPVPASP